MAIDKLLPENDSRPPLACGSTAIGYATWLGLAAIVTAGTVLRVWQVGDSLWVDELHTSWTAADGIAQIQRRAAFGNNSPLYFYLPWISSRLIGYSEVGLRLPSMVAGIALMPVCFAVALAWTRRQSMALLAASLVAIDPHALFYSLEARPYAWVQLLAIVNVWLFWRLVQTPDWPRYACYVVATVILFYLHYTTILLPLAQAVFALGCALTRKLTGRQMTGLSVAYAVIGLCCTPAADHLAEIASRRVLWEQFIPKADFNDIWRLFPINAHVGSALIATAAVAAWNRLRRSRRPACQLDQMPAAHRTEAVSSRKCGWGNGLSLSLVAYQLCWLLVPLLLAWAATHTDLARLFFRRYLLVSSCASILLAATVGSWGARGKREWIVAGTVLAATFAMVGPWRVFLRNGVPVLRSHEDWRSAVVCINNNDRDTCPALVWSGLIEAELLSGEVEDMEFLRSFCLAPVTNIYSIACPNQMLVALPKRIEGRTFDDAWDLIVRHRHTWLLVRGRPATVRGVTEQLLAAASKRGGRLEVTSIDRFGTVTLLHLKMAND